MGNSSANKAFQPEQLDTLAGNGTSVRYVFGTGCNVSTDKAKKRRGKAKLIGNKLSLALVDVAKAEGDTDYIQNYYNGFHCLRKVIYRDGVIFGHYCGNRFCPTCCGIRKAEMINKYLPVLKDWPEPYFLTLTSRACKANNLEDLIKKQKYIFSKIINKHKKQDQRGTGKKIICIRSHESNFNPKSSTYNPHFHIITYDKETSIKLNVEWLRYCGKEMVSSQAQKMRPVEKMEKDLIETIKYGTKVFTEPEMKKGLAQSDNIIYVKAMHQVLKAFKGHQMFSSFGFKLPKAENKSQTITLLPNSSTLTYLPSAMDWVNLETGSMLTGYSPDFNLVQKIKDVNKELM